MPSPNGNPGFKGCLTTFDESGFVFQTSAQLFDQFLLVYPNATRDYPEKDTPGSRFLPGVSIYPIAFWVKYHLSCLQ
ncbi:MAG: hypothetical protein R2874_14180 [Desulfobacterales bacterium]